MLDGPFSITAEKDRAKLREGLNATSASVAAWSTISVAIRVEAMTMPEVLQTLVLYLVVGMLLVALALFLIALRYFRAGRREPYWRRRRAASLHGWQLFLVSLTVAFVAASICLFTGFAQMILGSGAVTPALPLASPGEASAPTTPPSSGTVTPQPPQASPRSISSPERTLLVAAHSETAIWASSTPTRQARPTASATVSSAPQPSATATWLTPSPSPTVTPTQIEITPLPSSVTPPPEAVLQIVAVDSSVTNDLMPVNPRTVFEAGIVRVYFWVTYAHMMDGVAWERLLLRNGVLVQGGAYLWNGGEEGTEGYFFGDAEGFAPGEYEIRLMLGEVIAAATTFVVE